MRGRFTQPGESDVTKDFAENSIFIDDNLKNIESAKEIGFQCIHFSDGTDLKAVLKQMNIL